MFNGSWKKILSGNVCRLSGYKFWLWIYDSELLPAFGDLDFGDLDIGDCFLVAVSTVPTSTVPLKGVISGSNGCPGICIYLMKMLTRVWEKNVAS